MAKEKESTVDTTKKEKIVKVEEQKDEVKTEKVKNVKPKKETTKSSMKKKQEPKTEKAGISKDKKQDVNEELKLETTEEIKQEEKSIEPVEESISIQEIKETIYQKQKFPKEEEEKINRYVFRNILVALSIIIYFIFLNLGQMNIGQEVYITDLKVFSMCILFLAIALIEKAYKKDDGSIALYGVEMIVLALITVALIYIDLMLSTRYTFIVTAISYVFAIYYLIKCIVIYLRGRKKYFVDNMKEIINNKEE